MRGRQFPTMFWKGTHLMSSAGLLLAKVYRNSAPFLPAVLRASMPAADRSKKRKAIYGTTLYGGGSSGCSNGSFGCGTVFELRKSAKGYRENIIFRFNGQDGYKPDADLTLDSKNRLYGPNFLSGVYVRTTDFPISS